MAIIGQLLAPVAYIRIRDDRQLKLVVDWGLPLVITAMIAWALVAAPGALPVLGENGFSDRLSGLLEALVGFYIAALAAVATFPNTSLLADTHGIYLKGTLLKRRTFLSYVFGYLAFLSVLIYASGLLSPLLNGLLKLVGNETAYSSAVGVLRIVYFVVCFQMFSVTLLGLYYLTVRIHEAEETESNTAEQPAQKATTPPKGGTRKPASLRAIS